MHVLHVLGVVRVARVFRGGEPTSCRFAYGATHLEPDRCAVVSTRRNGHRKGERCVRPERLKRCKTHRNLVRSGCCQAKLRWFVVLSRINAVPSVFVPLKSRAPRVCMVFAQSFRGKLTKDVEHPLLRSFAKRLDVYRRSDFRYPWTCTEEPFGYAVLLIPRDPWMQSSRC